MDLTEWISKGKAIKQLGIGRKLFDRLVEDGFLPEGLEINDRVILWRRRKIDAVAELLPAILKKLSREVAQK